MRHNFYARLKEDTWFNAIYDEKRTPVSKGTIVEAEENKYVSIMRYATYYEFYSTEDRSLYLEEL